MFTPCPKELNQAAARQLAATRAARARRATAKHEGTGGPAEANTSVVTAEQPERHADRLPFVGGITAAFSDKVHPAKLCHDLKGLYTPCPKAGKN